MYRHTVWALAFVIMATPLALGQGPPDDPPGGPPGSPSGDADETRGDNTSRPNERGARPDTPGGPPVRVNDARDGFGARPSDPGAQRPAFAYNASRGSMAVDRADAPGLTGAVDAVIEFHDDDGDGAYDLGEPVLQRHALRDLVMEIKSPAQHLRDVHYALPDNGSLTLRFHLVSAAPEQAAKFDIIFDAFPFSESDSRVAMAMGVGSIGGLRLGSVDGTAALVGAGSGERPYLSWLDNASADGQEVLVATSVHVAAEGDGGMVYWAYPQAAHIVHDPALGYVFVSLDQLGDAVAFTAALAVGGVLMLAGYEARRRFRA